MTCFKITPLMWIKTVIKAYLEGSWGHTVQFLWQNIPLASCWWKKDNTLCGGVLENKISALIFCFVNCDLWGAVSWAVPTAPGQGRGAWAAQRQKYSPLLAAIYMWTRMFPGWEIKGWDVPCRLLGSEESRRAVAPIPSDSMCLPGWAEPAGWKQSLSSCLLASVDNFCNVKATSSTQVLCTFLHMRSHCSGCSVCVLSFQLLDLHSWILYVWKVKFLLETLS